MRDQQAAWNRQSRWGNAKKVTIRILPTTNGKERGAGAKRCKNQKALLRRVNKTLDPETGNLEKRRTCVTYNEQGRLGGFDQMFCGAALQTPSLTGPTGEELVILTSAGRAANRAPGNHNLFCIDI